MEDNAIVDLYWQRSEQAIPETEHKYGGYCHTVAMLQSSLIPLLLLFKSKRLFRFEDALDQRGPQAGVELGDELRQPDDCEINRFSFLF